MVIVRKVMTFVCFAAVLFVAIIPSVYAEVDETAEIEGTLPGQISVFLYESGTGSEQSGVNNIRVSVGDTISVDVFLRNNRQESVTGLDLYFTIPDDYFSIVSQGINTDGTPKPFIEGSFMQRAQAYVPLPRGNWTHGDSLTSMDNTIPGWQIDYITLSPVNPGKTRPSTNLRYGVAATFKLIAKVPCDSISIPLDIDSYNVRVSRYKQLDSSDSYYYKTFKSCYISVSGIVINPPLPDIVMLPASVDTTLDLDEHIGVASIPDSLFIWEASGNSQIGVSIDPSTHQVTFTSPLSFHGYEDIVFTVGSVEEPNMAADTLRVIVDYPPVLDEAAIPDTLVIHEDLLETLLFLPDIVSDADDSFGSLLWTFRTGENLTTLRTGAAGDTLKGQGKLNYYGMESMTIVVSDTLGLADSTTVAVSILTVNDAPVITGLPDAEFERTKSYQINIAGYASDADNDPLTLSFGEPQHLNIVAEGMTVTITEQEGFIGSEDVVFTVQDPSGLAGSDTMTVSVVPLKLPPVWQKIPKIGFAQGGTYSDLMLWNYVDDLDGEDSELSFSFSGYDDVDSLYVDPSDGRLFLYDLDDTPGWDWVTVGASDYDGNESLTRFLVFIAPKDGTPIVGAIPDTTMRAGRPLEWIDLDDYYYDIDNTDSEMSWTWSRVDADSLVYPNIHTLFHTVTLTTYNSQSTGVDNIAFTVTDTGGKSASDDCLITVLGETKPVLDMPSKIGFVTGDSTRINLDSYVEDPDFEDDRLTWSWWGNQNVEMGYDTTDTTFTRPFYLTGTAGWIGWERVFFRVTNPLDSSATDSTLVFSVPADGTPVAGGLLYVYLRAGECNTTEIDLDDYYYDADTPDWEVTWTATGNDNIQVSIDPTTHRAQFCSPSDTFEGQEIITLTVSDGVHEASMDVTVVVLEAALRNVFALMVFRNPMQSDYMDFYLESKAELAAEPVVDVRVATDSSFVTMKAVGDSATYYHGMYLLPYDSSLGIERNAVVIAGAQTKTGKAVEDTLSFTYGRYGPAGGKLALGPVTVDVPPGALKSSVLLTIVPVRTDNREDAAKTAAGEIVFNGLPYSIGPERLVVEEPFTVGFALCCRADGAGIYRSGPDGWEYLSGASGDGIIYAETMTAGTFRLGFDRTPPEVALETAGDGRMTFTVNDRGSGVDESSLRVTRDGEVLAPRFDPSA